MEKPCPEERCRQMRFFGKAVGYTKGHPKCERCKGSGVVTEQYDFSKFLTHKSFQDVKWPTAGQHQPFAFSTKPLFDPERFKRIKDDAKP